MPAFHRRAAHLATISLLALAALLAPGLASAQVPSISINDVSVSEGNSGAKTVVFTVSLSAPATQEVGFWPATGQGNAIGNDDFQHAYGCCRTIPVGQTTTTLSVVVFGDTQVEADETFTVLLENVTGATVAKDVGIGTIVNDDAGAAPELLVGDVLVTEGNSGTRTATFTVQLSKAAATPVSFNLATANGTASASSDYVALNATNQSIPAGQLYKSFSVAINGDATPESDETFTVNLSNASGAGVARAQATGIIANDDNVPTVKIQVFDTYVTEGNAGTKVVTFGVWLSKPATSTVTFDIRTEDSSATAPGDYVARALSGLTIPIGQQEKQFEVTLNGDTLPEDEERFVVVLSKVVNAAIEYGDYHGVATIPNDDATLSIGDATFAEGNGGTTTFTFPVTLSSPVSDTVQFHVDTCDGTATAASGDYWAKSGIFYTYINAGTTSANVTVDVQGDAEVEPDETFCVDLSDISGATALDTHAVGTIVNDDLGPPTVTLGDASVLEGDSSVQQLEFPLTLSHLPAHGVTLRFHSEACDGSAEPDVTNGPYQEKDYIPALGGTIYITTGTQHSLTVGVRGDTVLEPDEHFCLVVEDAGGAPLDSAKGTILNDDSAPMLAIDDVAVLEGDADWKLATFAVWLSKPAAVPVTFDIATGNGTASPGSDYVEKRTNAVTFPPGQTWTTFSVQVNGDTEVEGHETFTVDLSNVTGADVADAQGLGTITNTDQATLSVANLAVAEGDAGTRTASFVVTLSQPMPTAVAFDIATVDGSATAGSDYVARSQVGRVLDAGRTQARFEVVLLGDTQAEGPETFAVVLNNIVGALPAGNATGTLLEDDAATASIARIQGRGALSPLLGQSVTTEGVVTALTSDGFFLQSDAPDADPATSEGLFVADAAPRVARGDRVRASGVVQEASADGESPTLTRLAADGVAVLAHGQALPQAVLLDARNAGPGPGNALERSEGMRVSVPRLRVVGPSQRGTFFGVAEGLARPFRKPGRAGGDPERLRVVPSAQRGAPPLAADAGDRVEGLAGVLGFARGAFELLPDPAAAPRIASGAHPRPVPPAAPGVATLGLMDVAGVRAGDGTLDAVRLAKAANVACAYARSPAILAVTGIGGADDVEALTAAIDTGAGNLLFPGACPAPPRYVAHAGRGLGLLVDTTELRPGLPRVLVRATATPGAGETFTHRDGTREPLHAAAPVRVDARIHGADGRALELTVIAVRFTPLDGALGSPGAHGWRTRGDALRARRAAQARSLARIVQAQRRAAPGRALVVLGDFEASAFDDGQADLLGSLARDTGLVNLAGRLPREARYTVVREGRAEAVDHVLVDASLLAPARGAGLAVARVNADFGEDNAGDAAVPMRVSAHDPLVLGLEMP